MARQGDREFKRMKIEDRQAISDAIMEVLAEFDLVMQHLFEDGVGSPESRAASFVAAEYDVTSQGTEPMQSAIRSVLFSVLAGMDHARLFARCLVAENPSMGLATLTRGSIEAYGRAWWLMDSRDGDELLTRWLSGWASELNTAISIGQGAPIQEMRGGTTTPEALLALVVADLSNVSASGKPVPVRYTTLATAVADKINTGGRALYSHLSAVAHGESLGVNGFFGVDDDEDVYLLGITERWALYYAEQVFSSTSFVVGELITFMGYGREGTEPWVVAHDRANDLLIAEHIRVEGEAPIHRPG